MTEKEYDDLNEDPDSQLDDDEISVAEAGFTRGAEEGSEESSEDDDEVK